MRLVWRQSFFRYVERSLESGCSFVDEEGSQCGGRPKVISTLKSGKAFVGCSDWTKGDPPIHRSGHMARWVPAGVDVDMLKTWLGTGVELLEPSDNCVFIAPKRSREKYCKRHGGEFPALVRAAAGECPVRVEFYSPTDMVAGTTVRAIVVLRGAHSHVFPVCKPSTAVVRNVVDNHPSLPIRTLQVCILRVPHWTIDRGPQRDTVLFYVFFVVFLTLPRTLGHHDVNI